MSEPPVPSERDLPDATVRYADHADGVADVHLPAEPGGRVLVFLHGGFWRARTDRTHTRPLARAWADDGWTVVTPEYRRVGAGGGWPTTAADVRDAVRRVPGLLAGLGVDTSDVVLSGHSAGGQLTLWLVDEDVPVDRFVALAPVCDLREGLRLRLGDGAIEAFLDGADAAPADPMTRLGDHRDRPVRIVHGVEDDVVPVSLSRGLVARHPWVDLVEVPGDHFALITPGTADFEQARR